MNSGLRQVYTRKNKGQSERYHAGKPWKGYYSRVCLISLGENLELSEQWLVL